MHVMHAKLHGWHAMCALGMCGLPFVLGVGDTPLVLLDVYLNIIYKEYYETNDRQLNIPFEGQDNESNMF